MPSNFCVRRDTMIMPSTTVFYGPVINPVSLSTYQALPRCLLAVGANGNIEWIVDDVPDFMVQQVLSERGWVDIDVYDLKDGEFLMPGFIDTHTHAPQVPNIGSGQHYELLDWLKHVTFPMEAKFANPQLAEQAYSAIVRRIIDSGTTTCCYYATLHLESTQKLADIVHSYGQRAFIGKCNMNRHSPDDYIEQSHEQSIEATKSLITYIRSLELNPVGQPLVHPILTPRFAISCTPSLLESLGTLASSDPSLHIQSHISEHKSEVALTKELFRNCSSYAGVYDSFGLLRSNTILAHAIHLEPEDKELIVKRNAGISHCPTSNFNLSSGVAPIGEYLDLGIKVGLGTDVSGGFSTSILQAIRDASIAAKVTAMQSSPQALGASTTQFAQRKLSIATLLYLATLGGAEVCCLEKQVGSFAAGKSFDALLVDTRNKEGHPGFWGSISVVGGKNTDQFHEMLERFLFCGDDRNISKVFVQGRLIGGSAR